MESTTCGMWPSPHHLPRGKQHIQKSLRTKQLSEDLDTEDPSIAATQSSYQRMLPMVSGSSQIIAGRAVDPPSYFQITGAQVRELTPPDSPLEIGPLSPRIFESTSVSAPPVDRACSMGSNLRRGCR